jgi:formiminotetrahydrofolate cyclodeaminase
MKEALNQTERLRFKLTGAIEADAHAFNDVMTAIKLPHETPEEISQRDLALEEAYRKVIEVPLSVMEDVRALLIPLKSIAEKGNINLVADAGVGVLMAQAACEGAKLNVEINLQSIADAVLKDTTKNRAAKLSEEVKQLSQEILEIVRHQ